MTFKESGSVVLTVHPPHTYLLLVAFFLVHPPQKQLERPFLTVHPPDYHTKTVIGIFHQCIHYNPHLLLILLLAVLTVPTLSPKLTVVGNFCSALSPKLTVVGNYCSALSPKLTVVGNFNSALSPNLTVVGNFNSALSLKLTVVGNF